MGTTAWNNAVSGPLAVGRGQSTSTEAPQGVARGDSDEKRLARLGRPHHAKYLPSKLDPEVGSIYALYPGVTFGMYEARFADAATR